MKFIILTLLSLKLCISSLKNLKRGFVAVFDPCVEKEPTVRELLPSLLPSQRTKIVHCDIPGRVTKS